MREETTTLLQPSAWRQETGFCSDWTERLPEDYSLASLAYITPKRKLQIWVIILHQTVS